MLIAIGVAIGRMFRPATGGAPSTSVLLIEGGVDNLLIEGGTDALLLQA